MFNLKKLIVDTLVSNIQISDAILIAANNAVKENGKTTEEDNVKFQKIKGVSK